MTKAEMLTIVEDECKETLLHMSYSVKWREFNAAVLALAALRVGLRGRRIPAGRCGVRRSPRPEETTDD